jgi:hypothetical protein
MAVLTLEIPDAQVPRVVTVARRATGDQTSGAAAVVKIWLITHIRQQVKMMEAAQAATDAAAAVQSGADITIT